MKNKKVLAVTLASLTLISGVGMTACGGGTTVNPSGGTGAQNEIVFSVYNGGYGYTYMQNLAKKWNDANAATMGYEIAINPNKDEWYSISSAMEAGVPQSDIYMTSAAYLAEAKANGWIENLNDVVTTSLAEENVSIEDKFSSSEKDTLKYIHTVDNEYYAIPLSTDFMGFVYDHQLFLDNNLLISDNGGLITGKTDTLSKGRDGKYGTFDDGHPKDMAEYQLMLGAIINLNWSAYLYSGKMDYYLTPAFSGMQAEYDGFENYIASLNYNLNYTNPVSGTVTEITEENGYEVYNMEGVLRSLQFAEDYLTNPVYYHSDSIKSTSHTDVQKTYVYANAFNGSTGTKQSAFLYEGVWWENEAAANFNSLKNNGKNDYAFGSRDYRMMMLPIMDSYQQDTGYVMGSFGSLSLVVAKQSKAEKLAAIKSFLKFIYEDESLQEISVSTGMIVPYTMNISDTKLEEGTKFFQNMYKLYHSDSVKIVRQELETLGQRSLTYYTSKGNNSSRPHKLLERGAGITQKGTAEDVYAATYAYYKKNW